MDISLTYAIHRRLLSYTIYFVPAASVPRVGRSPSSAPWQGPPSRAAPGIIMSHKRIYAYIYICKCKVRVLCLLDEPNGTGRLAVADGIRQLPALYVVALAHQAACHERRAL